MIVLIARGSEVDRGDFSSKEIVFNRNLNSVLIDLVMIKSLNDQTLTKILYGADPWGFRLTKFLIDKIFD